ncbi:MAG: DUF642 domain-containing protein [Planctomycetaceae bacterium]
MKMSRMLIVVCVASSVVSTCSANLIQNGSFEDPVVPINWHTNFIGGSTSITGWTVVGVDSSVSNGGFSQNGILFQAQDGVQWADMAGISSNSNASGLTQDVATTIGNTYELTFHVGSATDGGIFFFPATVDLRIDGGPRTSYFNPAAPTNMLDWKQFSVRFLAQNSLTNLTFFNGSAANNYISPLDNVSLVDLGPAAVPEPGTLTLAAFGAVGCLAGAIRRRRRHFN